MVNIKELLYKMVKQTNSILNFYQTWTSLTRTNLTNGTDNGWTASSFDCAIIGGCLRIYIAAARSSSYAASRGTNERIATATFNHGGKIKSGAGTISNISFCAGATGPYCSMSTASVATTDSTITIGINFNGTSITCSSINAYICLGFVPNLQNY